MVNADIRYKLFESGVKHWRIAQRLGIDASTFSRRLRDELPDDEKAVIMNLINEEANNGEQRENSH